MTHKRFTLHSADNSTLGTLVGDYSKNDDLVGTVYNGQEVAFVRDATPPDAETEIAAKELRATRNNFLAASDWTQLPDAPVDRAAWATYRQALRDLTTQDGFPETVVWPVAPN